jgi:NO-binding membrane sensor protein with MHYT domain
MTRDLLLPRILAPAVGASLAAALVLDVAENLPTPALWHLVCTALLFTLSGSLHYTFMAGLALPAERVTPGACLLNGGLALAMAALGTITLVRGLCAS